MSGSFENTKSLKETQNPNFRDAREGDMKPGSYKKLLCNPLASLVSSIDDNPVSSNVAVLGLQLTQRNVHSCRISQRCRMAMMLRHHIHHTAVVLAQEFACTIPSVNSLPGVRGFDQTRSRWFSRAMSEHARHWAAKLQECIVVAFGPVLDRRGGWGVGILRGRDEASVEAMRDADPALLADIGCNEILPMMTAVY